MHKLSLDLFAYSIIPYSIVPKKSFLNYLSSIYKADKHIYLFAVLYYCILENSPDYNLINKRIMRIFVTNFPLFMRCFFCFWSVNVTRSYCVSTRTLLTICMNFFDHIMTDSKRFWGSSKTQKLSWTHMNVRARTK
jgi:hypothetical protein